MNNPSRNQKRFAQRGTRHRLSRVEKTVRTVALEARTFRLARMIQVRSSLGSVGGECMGREFHTLAFGG